MREKDIEKVLVAEVKKLLPLPFLLQFGIISTDEYSLAPLPEVLKHRRGNGIGQKWFLLFLRLFVFKGYRKNQNVKER